ncbi:type IV pilus assembly protein FimV [Paludibacterium purpuratum]|uniref:Tetratricopeptide repeat protein n=1 Tax=Paludibacterium purpuratum TaxID=1144873 RepID=A0A4R7B7M7_9NEIS|nr:tetratricopeptide repeat protein [Paludibacterium purpuratum]TDR80774.1 tetratricopeptide repeat protein [Paludibacterium purpuratum]
MMWLTAMASSLGCMLAFYGARKIWRTVRYTKPRHRGIDPVGEAEVFLAYGRTKDAVRVLRDALRDEPDNLAAKVTLLRAYSTDGNVRAYSSLAHDVQESLRGQAVWSTIQRNGRDMDPGNPLFNT